MSWILTIDTPFGPILNFDQHVIFDPETIAQTSDADLIAMLRWWESRGPAIYEQFLEAEYQSNHPEEEEEEIAGIVYFLRREDGLTKIGYTRHRDSRYSRLRDKHGPLEVQAEFPSDNPPALEIQMHKEFAQFRVKGEWFRLPDEEVELLVQMLDVMHP